MGTCSNCGDDFPTDDLTDDMVCYRCADDEWRECPSCFKVACICDDITDYLTESNLED